MFFEPRFQQKICGKIEILGENRMNFEVSKTSLGIKTREIATKIGLLTKTKNPTFGVKNPGLYTGHVKI